MKAVVIHESLTGNTRRAALLIAENLRRRGVDAVAFATTAIDYQALSEAELVIVGTWTDGVIVVGTQRPGRAGRLRKLPWVTGKRCVVFCTYAIHPGRTLEKLQAIVEDRGGEVLGGLAIRRTEVDQGAEDLVERVLAEIAA